MTATTSERRHVVSFQKPVSGGSNSFGEPEPVTWTEVGKAYVSIDPVSLRALSGAAEQTLAGAEGSVDLWWIAATPSVKLMSATPGWRIVEAKGQQRVFDIQTVRRSNKADNVIFLAKAVVGSE